MSLTEKINQDIKKAMLSKDKERLMTLRDIKSKILLELTSGKAEGELNEAKESAIILKLYKQRMESHNLYKEQGRDDLAEVELTEAKIIEVYMPKQMSEDEVKEKVLETIQQLGASGMKDMGKVMGVLTNALAGKADGKLISQIVKQELSK